MFAMSRNASMFSQWLKLSCDMMQVNLEAQHVIALRLSKLALGGKAAEIEAQRMITEKVSAAAEAAAALATGKSSRAVVRRYRTLVRANARRLGRG